MYKAIKDKKGKERVVDEDDFVRRVAALCIYVSKQTKVYRQI